MESVLEFMSEPIIKHMLMLDCAFYGIGIAYIIAGNFEKQENNLLDVYCPCIAQNYVQRFLDENGAEKHGQPNFMCPSYFTYSIKNFVMQIHFDNRPLSEIITRSSIDIGNFYINRMGVFTQSRVDEAFPYLTLMQRCLQRKCKINTKSMLSDHIYVIIKELYEKGWTIENIKIKFTRVPRPFQCPICHNNIEKDSVLTACNHQFCNHCWNTFWNGTITKRTGIFHFNLESDPNIVACPMCRHEMKSWECVPYDV